MRSRERLIEVLRSVNVEAHGVNPMWAGLLRDVGDYMSDMPGGVSPQLRRELWHFLSMPNQSPHLRDLAKNALAFGCSFAETARLDQVNP